MANEKRLIDANALIKHMKDLPTRYADGGGSWLCLDGYPKGMFDPEDVISSIENAPTVDAGGSVAMGVLDPETMQPSGTVEYLYGDYDAAGYLAKILELLSPRRQVNIPDLEAIVKEAYAEGNDLICDYCKKLNCPDCIVREWKDEV